MASFASSLSLPLNSTTPCLHPLLHFGTSSSPSSLSRASPSSLPFRVHHLFSSPPSAPSSHVFSTPNTTTFLTPSSFHGIHTLDSFHRTLDLGHGSLELRRMLHDELDQTAHLLAESFSESWLLPAQYTTFLAFLVKQYLLERRGLVPHAVVLVGVYREGGANSEEEAQLACTAEVSFDAVGANKSTPSPVPPLDCPYICNMTTKKTLRRRGIGSHLLKACEDLISQMQSKPLVYLHCRVIDTGPFTMYTRAGYRIVMTDSILIWLTLQRRKHLMLKELPVSNDDLLDNLNNTESNPI